MENKPLIIFKANQIGQRLGHDPRTIIARLDRLGIAPVAVDVSGVPYFDTQAVTKLSEEETKTI